MPKENLSEKPITKASPKKFHFSILKTILPVFLITFIIALFYYLYQKNENELFLSRQQHNQEKIAYEDKIFRTQLDLDTLKNTDQVKRNDDLEKELESIKKEYRRSVPLYEEILKLQESGVKTQSLTSSLTKAVNWLSERNYSSASSELTSLTNTISQEKNKLASVQAPVVGANVPQIKEAPSSGYRTQSVSSEVGTFVVDVVAADLNSTKVVVETASSGDCSNNCPVSSLGDFVGRAGGFAGINGPYFCPAEYPSCSGKTNSFDTLLMNKQKTYFNSDNNVYSSVPAVIFSGSSVRYVGQSSQWGRDTGVDAVIANQPLLITGGEIRFNGDGDPKKGSRGNRSFIGSTGSTVYIGVVRGATVAEVGYVLKSMGIQNGLNLDSGGSTAFFANGRYIAGPGRNTPFGIILVRR